MQPLLFSARVAVSSMAAADDGSSDSDSHCDASHRHRELALTLFPPIAAATNFLPVPGARARLPAATGENQVNSSV